MKRSLVLALALVAVALAACDEEKTGEPDQGGEPAQPRPSSSRCSSVESDLASAASSRSTSVDNLCNDPPADLNAACADRRACRQGT